MPYVLNLKEKINICIIQIINNNNNYYNNMNNNNLKLSFKHMRVERWDLNGRLCFGLGQVNRKAFFVCYRRRIVNIDRRPM